MIGDPGAGRWHTLRRWAFAGYALVLFTATHWPALKIEGSGRPDIWIHIGAFCVWTLTFTGAGFFGPPLSRRNIGRAWIVGVMYAAVDEGLQAIPWVRRTAAWDDYAADVGGITLGVVLALLAARLWARGPLRSPPS